jgi:hypothetical protein
MKSVVVLLDVSNKNVSEDIEKLVYGVGREKLSGVLGELLNEWKASRKRSQIVIGKLNSATVAAPWATILLPDMDISSSGIAVSKTLKEHAAKIRKAINDIVAKSGAKDTHIVLGLARQEAKNVFGPETTVYIASDGIEQSELINLYQLRQTSKVFDMKKHGKVQQQLVSALQRSRVDLRGSNVIFWLTGSESEMGRWNQVIGAIWGHALKQVGANDVKFLPIGD